MPAPRPVPCLAPNPPALPVRALGRCATLAWLACLLCLPAGCRTDQQERFEQYNAEGVQLFRRGDYAGAREHFEVALTLGPQDANVQYNLGQCHDRLAQGDRALACYQQCLALAPNHAECRHALAVLLYRSGRRADADAMIEAWLVAEPKLGAAYAEDGWRLQQAGETTLAVGRFQQALHFDPKNQRALLDLGQIYEEHERPEFALTMYSRALELDPNQPAVKDRINQLRARGIRPPLAE
jgi:Flp pilus assembly protein TadD